MRDRRSRHQLMLVPPQERRRSRSDTCVRHNSIIRSIMGPADTSMSAPALGAANTFLLVNPQGSLIRKKEMSPPPAQGGRVTVGNSLTEGEPALGIWRHARQCRHIAGGRQASSPRSGEWRRISPPHWWWAAKITPPPPLLGGRTPEAALPPSGGLAGPRIPPPCQSPRAIERGGGIRILFIGRIAANIKEYSAPSDHSSNTKC